MGRRKPRKGRASGQGMTRRGLHICQKGGQIKALSGNRWDMACRGTKDTWYRVSFAGESPTCKCAYHATGKGCRCKRIAAVGHALPVSSGVALGRKIDVREQDRRARTVGKGGTPATDGIPRQAWE